MLSTEPAEGHDAQWHDPDDETRRERPDRGRAGERPERQPLLVRAAVQDAIDEDRPADDRGREPVAGQQRDERGRRERQAPEEPRVEERIVHAQAADDGQDGREGRRPEQDDGDDDGVDRRPGDVLRAQQGQAQQPGDQGQPVGRRPDDVHPTAAMWRLPVRRRRPRQDQRDDPDRDVEVEHPAPGGFDHGRERRAAHPCRRDDLLRMERGEDGGADHGPGRHAEEGQGADHAQRPRPHGATEQVRGDRRPDRDQDAAADPLDEPCRDELVHRLGGARQRGPDGEHGEGPDQQAAGAPQVRQAARHRHGQDVDEQVAVDDPARLAELDPCGAGGRVREIGQDRGQRDGRDHELEAGQEHARPDDGEQHIRRSASHEPECRRPDAILPTWRPCTRRSADSMRSSR